ncbi:MAG: hypothetical protein A3F72_10705 [Bacteroidetes bacterium RIFCSPLOWO2_12_FULL_35_15]|nr:MAG: hypothetical protein A3F72_10705 [Bacteroidetes bacterium RIFCSPLOWO2_12_FULL_35_15]
MKKNILFAGLGFMLLGIIWNEQHTRNFERTKHANAFKQSEIELLQLAQSIFQPLRKLVENKGNLITQEKVKLGKLLFYDTQLSKNKNNSCNSCHNLTTYGVDNYPTSKFDVEKFGIRNSPTILNASLQKFLYWDGRVTSFEDHVGGAILNPIEMAIPSKKFLLNRLRKIKEYEKLFKSVFPSDKEPISFPNIQNSIAAFERTLITPSPFDNYLMGDPKALNSEQKEGLKTFIETGCIQCHYGVAIGGYTCQKFGVYDNYRLYIKSKTNDEGKKSHTKLEIDKDVFKVSSLRNVTKTFPYFHDGSVMNLNKAVAIMGKTELNKNLTNVEVNNIVAFLNSLTGKVSEEAQLSTTIFSQK